MSKVHEHRVVKELFLQELSSEQVEELREQLVACQAQEQRLRQYTEHRFWCASHWDDKACDCGLTALTESNHATPDATLQQARAEECNQCQEELAECRKKLVACQARKLELMGALRYHSTHALGCAVWPPNPGSCDCYLADLLQAEDHAALDVALEQARNEERLRLLSEVGEWVESRQIPACHYVTHAIQSWVDYMGKRNTISRYEVNSIWERERIRREK